MTRPALPEARTSRPHGAGKAPDSNRCARAPSGSPEAVHSFPEAAGGWRSCSSKIGPDATPPSGSEHRRRRRRTLAAALGGTILVLSPAFSPCAGPNIGRLFSTVEQRLELDRLRNQPDVSQETGPEVVESAAEPARAPPAFAVTIDGVVLRGDGHHLAWVNGVELDTKAAASAVVRIDADHPWGGQIRIRLPDGRANRVLKPGHTIDASGAVLDAYERRSPKGASEIPGDQPTDPDVGEMDEAAVTVDGPPDPIAPPGLPVRIVRALRQQTRSGSAPHDSIGAR